MAVSLIRTILLYIVIIAAVRIMGKRQISELQTSELVVTLLISDLASIPMQDTGQPLFSGLVPIGILVVCEVAISALMVKNSKFRKVVCGKPIIIINDGKVDQNEMRRLRMTIEDLFESLRQLNIFNINDVSYAIVETNGKMSIMKKPGKETTTANMLGVMVPETGIDAVVISDGEISDFSLSLCSKSHDWIEGILKGKNLSVQDVFIMTANKKGDYTIIEKEKKQ